MLDLPEALSVVGGVVLIVALAAVALVVFAVARFWWQFDHDEIEPEQGGSFGDQISMFRQARRIAGLTAPGRAAKGQPPTFASAAPVRD